MRTFLFLLAVVTSPSWGESEPAPAQPERATKAPSAAAGGSAVPTEDPAEARRVFRQLDRNGDGHLSGDELWSEQGRAANWAAVDRNRDGHISPDEFRVLRPR